MHIPYFAENNLPWSTIHTPTFGAQNLGEKMELAYVNAP